MFRSIDGSQTIPKKPPQTFPISEIKGKPVNLEMEYKGGAEENKGDEVEDLYLLLKEIKEKHPNLAAVSSGAIWSTYQKNRVENVYITEHRF